MWNNAQLQILDTLLHSTNTEQSHCKEISEWKKAIQISNKESIVTAMLNNKDRWGKYQTLLQANNFNDINHVGITPQEWSVLYVIIELTTLTDLKEICVDARDVWEMPKLVSDSEETSFKSAHPDFLKKLYFESATLRQHIQDILYKKNWGIFQRITVISESSDYIGHTEDAPQLRC